MKEDRLGLLARCGCGGVQGKARAALWGGRAGAEGNLGAFLSQLLVWQQDSKRHETTSLQPLAKRKIFVMMTQIHADVIRKKCAVGEKDLVSIGE